VIQPSLLPGQAGPVVVPVLPANRPEPSVTRSPPAECKQAISFCVSSCVLSDRFICTGILSDQAFSARFCFAFFLAAAKLVADDTQSGIFLLRKFQGSRINAKSLSTGLWAIVKDMAQMRTTGRTTHLGSQHPMTDVLAGLDIPGSQRQPEARPARPGIILCLRTEQCVPASDAGIGAVCLVVQKRAGKRRFGCLFLGYPVLQFVKRIQIDTWCIAAPLHWCFFSVSSPTPSQ